MNRFNWITHLWYESLENIVLSILDGGLCAQDVIKYMERNKIKRKRVYELFSSAQGSVPFSGLMGKGQTYSFTHSHTSPMV